MGIAHHTPGKIRYFTYYLTFPRKEGGDTWVDSVAFVHDLQYELGRTAFTKNPGVARDLLTKGEAKWSDHNGVTHRVIIEDKPRDRIWGVKRGRHLVRRRGRSFET